MSDIASLTRTEAEERSSLVSVDRYDISLDLTDLLHGSRWSAVSTITFRAEPGASTFVDCAMEIASATLNGTPIPTDNPQGRLPLTDLQAENVLVVESSTTNTGQGEGVLRSVDASDGHVYVWTSLEPDEARRVWACFDQPDLKAPHAFTVRAPESWVVTSNGAPDYIEPDGDATVWTYPDTPPLSTYVVVVNAGPFHEVRRQHDGYDLGFYCRQSLVPHLERDLDELVTLTRQGLEFFGEQFGVRFPQERYDQVFVPNLGGAMENWGCVTYGDTQLFRTPPSHAQRELRAEFVLHEMAHMWFGDLVTMRWWDDLWLNEAFASWASCWGLENATEHTDIFASFLTSAKYKAYEMDMSPATHPIRSDVPDVSAAMANFDAITYVKGQSVLAQLMAYIGRDAFVAGLQTYFADHAFANTTLDDLMSAFGEAAGQDLTAWTSAWLDRAGTDVLALDGSTLRAESPDGQAPRPHRIDVATFDTAEGLRPTGRTEVTVAGASTPVDLPDGALRLVNASDLSFAAVRPDAASRELMLEHVADLPEAIDRALVIGTCSQLLLLGELAPRDAASAAARALATEKSPALVEPLITMGLLWSDRWANPSESPELMRAMADAALVKAEDPTHRQVALRALAAAASTDAHWAALDEAAAGATDFDLAWRMAIRRAELDQHDDDAVTRLLESDPDPEKHVRRLSVQAARPDAEAKEEVWRAFFVDYSIPAGRETLVLGSTFWRPGQIELLTPYASRYLDELHTLKGGLLNQGVVIRAMFPQGVGDETFLESARAAAEDETLSPYARNQLNANASVLERILRARSL